MDSPWITTESSVQRVAIESGAEECISSKDFHEIHCKKEEIYKVKKKLEENISNFLSTDLEWLPLNSIVLSGEEKKNAIILLESLEDDDDVQKVFTNINFNLN